jgi:signal transduction histidine kinase
MLEVSGPDHRVCFVNDAFCRLVDKPREALLGRPFAEIVANGDICTPLLERVYKTGGFDSLPVPETPDSSGPFWLYSMWPALDDNARPVGVIIQLTRSAEARQDIAAMNSALLIGALRQHELREASEAANARLQAEIAVRVAAEKALHEAQAVLRAEAGRLEIAVAERTAELRSSVAHLEAFSYSLAHDLRAPVRAIQGYVQLALETPGSDTWPGSPFLHRVTKAATRMETLIQDVLSLNRIASQPIDVTALNVDALAHTLIAERPEFGPDRADILIESPLLPMLGHEASFGQVLVNLLHNAVKFVAPGSRPRVRLRTEPREGRVRLWVEDEGIGIAPEHRARIFELFQRLHPDSRYEGTGIGLAIVHKAVHRMGGTVGVEARQPQGSSFWVDLPRA